MDNIKVTGWAAIGDNMKYFECELSMSEQEFNDLSEDNRLSALKKYTDWEVQCGINLEKVSAIFVEYVFAVDPLTGIEP